MRKKIQILTLVLITTVSVILFHSGCKTNRTPEQSEIIYDIRGDWLINRIYSSITGETTTSNIICTFTGSKKNGTAVPESGETGTYNVGGDSGVEVEFFFSYYENGVKISEGYRGRFINEHHMEGTGTKKTEDEQAPFPFQEDFAWGAERR